MVAKISAEWDGKHAEAIIHTGQAASYGDAILKTLTFHTILAPLRHYPPFKDQTTTKTQRGGKEREDIYLQLNKEIRDAVCKQTWYA